MSLDTPFAVEHRHGPDGATLVLAGRVDRDAEGDLLAAFRAVDTSVTRVHLDFAATSYINSSGLAAIVALLADARARGIAVEAGGLTSHYRRLFEITRLSDLVEVVPEP